MHKIKKEISQTETVATVFVIGNILTEVLSLNNIKTSPWKQNKETAYNLLSFFSFSLFLLSFFLNRVCSAMPSNIASSLPPSSSLPHSPRSLEVPPTPLPPLPCVCK